MSAIKLPIRGKVSVAMLNEAPGAMFAMISPPQNPLAYLRYGEERVIAWAQEVSIIEGAASTRYVLAMPCEIIGKPPRQAIIVNPFAGFGSAGLVVKKAMPAFPWPYIESIFFDPDLRRQGIATKLISYALTNYPALSLNGHFTELGSQLFDVGKHGDRRHIGKPRR